MFDKNKFNASIVAAGKTTADVATAIGINRATLYRKISNDGAFTRSEIQKIVNYLKIENPIEIFFATQLA